MRRMNVFQPLKWYVWHQVLVMHNSPDCIKFILHELSQIGISHSGLAEIVHLNFILCPVFQLNFESSDHGKGSPQTVAGADDFSDFVFGSEFIDMRKYGLLHSHKIEIKSSVD
jgi:hypothetical protein